MARLIILILMVFQSVQDTYNSANADFDAGRWTEAAAKYEQVLKEDARNVRSRFNLAVCDTKLTKLEEAIAVYKTLLAQDPAIYEAHVNLGLLLEQTGKRPDAGEQFDKALALRPDDVQAVLNLGMFYLRGNELEKAYPHLVKAAQKGVATIELFAALSEVEHLRKDEAKSREYLQNALALEPNNSSFHRQLAVSYFDARDYVKAIPELEQVVKADPAECGLSVHARKSLRGDESVPAGGSAPPANDSDQTRFCGSLCDAGRHLLRPRRLGAGNPGTHPCHRNSPTGTRWTLCPCYVSG